MHRTKRSDRTEKTWLRGQAVPNNAPGTQKKRQFQQLNSGNDLHSGPNTFRSPVSGCDKPHCETTDSPSTKPFSSKLNHNASSYCSISKDTEHCSKLNVFANNKSISKLNPNAMPYYITSFQFRDPMGGIKARSELLAAVRTTV